MLKTNRTPARELPPNGDDIADFYALRAGPIFRYLRQEHFSFWMLCAYLFVEYVRPQSIIPALDILPWAQLFLILALIGRITDKKSRWVSDPANVWITMFLLIIVSASANATYPSVSWRHFMDFFSWYIVYFLVINIVNSERRLLIVIAIFLVASFKLSFFGARTWAMRGFSFTSWGLMGPPGYFQNSGELAIQMLMFAPLAYHLVCFLKPHLTPAKYFVMLLLPITGAMTVIGASNRGGQLALVYQAYRCFLKGRLNLKTIVLVGLIAAAGWSLLPQEQKVRFSESGSDKTSQQRLLYWTRGVEMIKEHPWAGVGYFNFPVYFAENYPSDMLYESAQLPHNIFIQVGTDTGIPGLVVFIMLMYRTVRSAREIKQSTRCDGKPFAAIAEGLLIAMWGFVIAGQFVTVTYYPFFWINLALTVSLRSITKAHVHSAVASDSSPLTSGSRRG